MAITSRILQQLLSRLAGPYTHCPGTNLWKAALNQQVTNFLHSPTAMHTLVGGVTIPAGTLVAAKHFQNNMIRDAEDKYKDVSKKHDRVSSILKQKKTDKRLSDDAINAEQDLMSLYLTGGGALAGGALGAGLAGEGNRLLGGTVGAVGGGAAGLLAHHLAKKYGYLS